MASWIPNRLTGQTSVPHPDNRWKQWWLIHCKAPVLSPHLLLAAAAKLPGATAVEFQLPTFEVLEINQRLRVLLALHPGHLVRLLADVLRWLYPVYDRHHLLRRLRLRDSGDGC